MKKLLIIGVIFCLSILSSVQAEMRTDNQISLVDPTRPALYQDPLLSSDQENIPHFESSSKEESAVEFRLHAIKINDVSRLAIINGETLRKGEKLGNAKLVKINAGSVDMDVNGEMLTISLLPGSIKKRSTR